MLFIPFTSMQSPTPPNDSPLETDLESYYDWSNADWIALGSYCLDIDWCQMFSYTQTSNDCWLAFVKVLKDGIQKWVPKKRTIPWKSQLRSLTPSRKVANLLLKKSKLWRKKKDKPTLKNDEKYKKMR